MYHQLTIDGFKFGEPHSIFWPQRDIDKGLHELDHVMSQISPGLGFQHFGERFAPEKFLHGRRVAVEPSYIVEGRISLQIWLQIKLYQVGGLADKDGPKEKGIVGFSFVF